MKPTSTSDMISLPHLHLSDNHSIRDCCLSAPADDARSILLLTRSDKRTFVFCQVSHKRKRYKNRRRWTEMSYVNQLERISLNECYITSLTCCAGNIYALCKNADGDVESVVQIEIMIGKTEVIVKLSSFGKIPFVWQPQYDYCFLVGSATALFCICVCFGREFLWLNIPSHVCMFKHDMTSYFDHAVLGGVDNLSLWKQVDDFEGIFVVDLRSAKTGITGFYNPVIDSNLSGFIHILGKKMDKQHIKLYSYHFKSQIATASPVTIGHISMWECWFEDDHKESKFIPEEEKETVVSLISESQLLSIHRDLLEVIMKHSRGFEYLNFRATCRELRHVAPPIKWQTVLGSLHDYSATLPLLLAVDQVQDIITLTHPRCGSQYHMRLPLKIHEGVICCSRFGWLLFKTSTYSVAFYNPFTHDLRQLPPTNTYCIEFWFSSPPTSPDCMVVGFHATGAEKFYVSGEPDLHWIDMVYSSPSNSYIHFLTIYKNDFYWLDSISDLKVFRYFDDENWLQLEYAAGSTPRLFDAQYYLVECDDKLLMVLMTPFGEQKKQLVVFKLDGMEWVRENEVGKHTIFISDKTCICVEAEPGLDNTVVIAEFAKKKLVFYSLKEEKFYTITDGFEELGEKFTTGKYMSAQSWIVPRWY